MWLLLVLCCCFLAVAVDSTQPSTGTDTEATLSAEYGGTGGSNAAVDAVYVALGRVLTISGRTIKDEAQVRLRVSHNTYMCICVLRSRIEQQEQPS